MRRREFLGASASGLLSLGGKQTFALGLYSLPQGPDPWRRAAEAGFQFVHSGFDGQRLDEARRHGMKVWVTVGSLKGPQDEARIRGLVGKWKARQEILFWETEDEPSFVWKKPREVRVAPEVIRRTYRLLKELDPARPLYLNHSPTHLVSTLAAYNPGGDFIATDVYPVIPHGIREQYALWPDGQQGDLLNPAISQVGQYMDKMRAVAGPNRGVWMVLQGFAWEMLREKDRDPRMVLYPARAQTRFMAFQSIVHGATGLLWWGLDRSPADAGVWEGVAETAREIRSLDAELLTPRPEVRVEVEYHETGHSLDRGVETAVRGAVLIAVNADKNPVEATLMVGKWKRRELFEPFGVRVWRVGEKLG